MSDSATINKRNNKTMNRKMKHLQLLFALLFLSGSAIFAQQVNHSQALSDLLYTKKWFDIESYYQQHKDSIDKEFVELLYIAKTGSAFNRPFESIEAYEQLIAKNPLNMDMPTLVGLFWQPLLQLLADMQEYEKAKELCRKLITFIKNDTAIDSELQLSYIQSFTQAIESFKHFAKIYPKQTIAKKDNREKEIELIPNDSIGGIFFNAKWNGKNLKTYFDTGAGTSYIYNRAIAEKIGVKYFSTDTLVLNNGEIRAFYGLIDRLELGEFVVKNVAVLVNLDTFDSADTIQVQCDSLMNSMFDIILGIPIIRHLGVIEFDFINNTMSFPQKTKNVNRRNLYIDQSNLFLNIGICDENLVTFFDTGGGGMGLIINNDFYEKNKECILVEEPKIKSGAFFGGCHKASFSHRNEYDCPLIEIKVNNQVIMLTNDCTVSKDKESDNKLAANAGGFMGNAILKYCKKATFDFENMVFSMEQ